MRKWMCVCIVSSLVVVASASSIESARSDFQASNPGARLYTLTSGYVGALYGAAFGFGESPEATAEEFRLDYASVLGARAEDLVPGNHFNENLTQGLIYDRDTDSYKFTLVYLRQERGGVPVFRGEARLLVRNEPGHPLVLVVNSLRDLGDFAPGGIATALRVDLGEARVRAAHPELAEFTEPREVIYAGVEDEVGVAPRRAVEFIGQGGEPEAGTAARRLFVTDAETGEILYEENLVLHATINGTVRGNATTGSKADLCSPEVSTAMPYAQVNRGAAVAYADVNGNFTIDDGGSSPVTLTSQLRGRYFNVNNQAGSDTELSMSVSAPGPANFLHNSANTSALNRAEVNAYLHANVVRDYALSYNPTYPTIATQLNFPVNVNIASTCNAYYNGSSINFYQAGGGCANTAFATVVHHEYGHHLVSVAGSGQGEYGEGMSDVMGVLITDESITGYGFNNNCNSGIRNANNNCQYTTNCSSCGSAIHSCGQLISGCVWSTRTNLLATHPATYRSIISNLAINAVLLHTGTSINSQITIHYLTLDDDNADIGDGSPHYAQIAAGFGAHNMPAPPLDPLAFEYPNGKPTYVSPAGGTLMRVHVLAQSNTPQPNTGKLYVRAAGDGVYTAIPMNQVSPNVYDAVFPSSPCGTTLEYYLSARTTTNLEEFDPDNAPTGRFTTLAAVSTSPAVFADSFDTDKGWTTQNGGATDGYWVRVDPYPVSGGTVQPGDDAPGDSSTHCYITGQATAETSFSPNATDVDGGPTHLISPVFSLSSDALISYYTWLYNYSTSASSPGPGTLTVYVSNNGGATWTTVASYGHLNAWTKRSFRVGAFIAPTSQMRVRFSVDENGVALPTEAGVDRFEVTPIDCGAPDFEPGDMNCDGTINPFDIDGFMLAISDPGDYPLSYPNCDMNLADIDGNGTINPFDIGPFLDLLN